MGTIVLTDKAFDETYHIVIISDGIDKIHAEGVYIDVRDRDDVSLLESFIDLDKENAIKLRDYLLKKYPI